MLFDLDGTLIDTAPDLVNALNAVLIQEGLSPYPLDQIRPTVSHGSIAMLNHVFGDCQPEIDLRRRQHVFLDYYQANIFVQSRLFKGMETVLKLLIARGIPWGVVTNKPHYLTLPLMTAMGLAEQASSIVSGDTLSVAKPHPAPLLLAAQQCGVLPQDCWYIGDAERDIIAGQSAGMHTVVAQYGYLSAADAVDRWQADAIIQTPLDLLSFLNGTQA
jgi:phosphoglycolate phosphatase